MTIFTDTYIPYEFKDKYPQIIEKSGDVERQSDTNEDGCPSRGDLGKQHQANTNHKKCGARSLAKPVGGHDILCLLVQREGAQTHERFLAEKEEKGPKGDDLSDGNTRENRERHQLVGQRV